MNPYAIIAPVALAAALAGGGYWKGWTDRAMRADLAVSEQTNAGHEQVQAEAVVVHQVATQLEQTDAKERIVYKTIIQAVDRIVDRPVYRSVCLDDNGLRLARAAIAGQTPDPAQPDGTVPGPADTR